MSFKNLFANSGLSPVTPASPTAKILENLQAVVNQGNNSFGSSDLAKSAISMEGFTSEKKLELETAMTNLSNAIDSSVRIALEGHGAINISQKQAAVVAGIIGANPGAYFTREIPSSNSIKAYASENVKVFGHDGIEGAMDQRAFALEAYDNKENKNAMVYSVAYNMQAARQDEFGEAFFPTVVVSPDNVGFMVSIRLIYVQEEVRRSLTGSLSNFGRKNIVRAIIDASILRNDQTRIVPIVRGGGGANDSTAFFVPTADVAPYTVINDNASLTTAPLRVGTTFDLLAVSQTAAMVAAGIVDQTDAIDSSVRLGAIYVKIAAITGTGGTPAQVVKFTVDKLPLSDFNFAVQGNTRKLQLNFDTDTLRVTSTTKDVAGAAVVQFTALTDKTVRLNASVYGSIIQDTGVTTVNSAATTVAKITGTDGIQLDQTTGAGATIAAVFAGATVIGYDLIAFRTDSNRRQRGQLIDTQFVNHLYTVPRLPPITALRPANDSEANDANLISSLITTTHVRTSNAAVTALLSNRDFLKDFVSASDLTGETPDILGVSRYILTPTYLEQSIDALTALDSLTSSQRAEDLTTLLINKVRDMAYLMYQTSGYQAAVNALYDGAPPKPLVIIGTDQYLKRYLTLTGDLRTLGEYFDVKLVSTLDTRVLGKIFIAFGMESTYNSGVPNPLHFGSMAFKPELTLMMPITRNGAISTELTVQPSFRHIVNTPIFGQLTVTNITAIIASKVTINNKVQP